MNSRASNRKMAGKKQKRKHLWNDKARCRTRVNIGLDQLSSAGENSRRGRPAIGCRDCFVSSR